MRGLQLCIEYFCAAGVPYKIFAPRGFAREPSSRFGRRSFFDTHFRHTRLATSSLRAQIDEHGELAPLARAGVLFATPGGLDDHFLIQHADNHGSFIVSNDRFADHARDRGYEQRWLDFHRVPFMFDPSFAPDPDALVRMRAARDGTVPPELGPSRARVTQTGRRPF